jgi:hypothetical protein
MVGSGRREMLEEVVFFERRELKSGIHFELFETLLRAKKRVRALLENGSAIFSDETAAITIN